jgi:ankyrin repeat protein
MMSGTVWAVERIALPSDVRRGQPFDVRIVLNNTAPAAAQGDGSVEGRLRIVRKSGGRDTVLQDQDVKLPPGKTVLTFREEIDSPDFYTYEARFTPNDPTQDTTQQNNRATTFTHVRGRGQILLIEDFESRGEHDLLVERLKAENLEVAVRASAADQLFGSLPELQPYDAVILANVPREHFSDAQIKALVRNTQQMGSGLVMLGGPNSFGAGGWTNTELEKAMPVDFQVKSAKVAPVGALAMVMHASEMGHKETLEALLGGGAQPNLRNPSGDTALLLATVEGYTDIVRVLLANNADASLSDHDETTPLIRASANCKTGIVSALLEQKIEVNAGDTDGRTALIASVVEGCSVAVASLLAQEADPNLADREGRTALMYAVESGRKNLIQSLLERNASVNAADNKGKSALTYAVIANRLDLAQQLLSEHADVDSRDHESQTPLMFAAAAGSEQMVQMLLDAGADNKAQTWSLRLTRYNSVDLPIEVPRPEQQRLPTALTALEIAKRTGQHAVVDLLEKAEGKRE